MISRKSILDWKVDYPWQLPEMVEQDLIICRAIVSIFSNPFLAKELAWKGGTALHKLYLKPQARYSEDMDMFLRPGITFNPQMAWSNVRRRLVDLI